MGEIGWLKKEGGRSQGQTSAVDAAVCCRKLAGIRTASTQGEGRRSKMKRKEGREVSGERQEEGGGFIDKEGGGRVRFKGNKDDFGYLKPKLAIVYSF